ncbi:MAG: undecaprenyldiphospho-muramoylpentapeptide beta-N-acetylglucosaminyltransferase [Micrococcales bacterium]|nr:MAG: undecaprenyldiphospho-muramoylpentapeptide beta-N-acetylglucosaminyltransferase [Micrococcales bacterium]PIE27313.1 MAG: undecaprenyldiphospho-muramoylpentapeptide beta-N-acetylglucosaminyltransferase [Micrococcales bacterium]
MSLSVVLAGGGSAGHVSPLLAAADALVRADPDTRITVLGTSEGLESRLVPARGYQLRTIAKVPMPRRLGADLIRLPGRLAGAVRATGDVLAEVQADVVAGMGGYVSPPAYLAARRAGLPIVVHEQNARAGIANRLGARLTRHVATAFDGTGLPHATRIGMPLRREITTLDRAGQRAAARAELGLAADAPVLLVTGGSLGAQHINEAMAQVLADIVADPWLQVLHITGTDKAQPVRQAVAAAGAADRYHVVEYLDRMELAYAAADLVLCRAGASTVCELEVVGLPAVYVPLPIGNGEQRLNAQALVDAGGGLLIDDADLDGARVRTEVFGLLGDSDRLRAMSAAAAGHGIADADDRLARMVLSAVAQRDPAGERR